MTLPALLKLLKIPTLLATLAALAHLSTYLSRAGLAGHASRAGHCSIACVPLVATVTLLKQTVGVFIEPSKRYYVLFFRTLSFGPSFPITR